MPPLQLYLPLPYKRSLSAQNLAGNIASSEDAERKEKKRFFNQLKLKKSTHPDLEAKGLQNCFPWTLKGLKKTVPKGLDEVRFICSGYNMYFDSSEKSVGGFAGRVDRSALYTDIPASVGILFFLQGGIRIKV